MLTKLWSVAPPAPDSFTQSVHEHPLLAQVLYNRGLRTASEVADFLAGDDAVTHNPFTLCDMAPAVQRDTTRHPARRNDLRVWRL